MKSQSSVSFGYAFLAMFLAEFLAMFSATFLCKISEVCHTVIQALKCSGIFRLYCERIISQLRSTAWGEIKYSNTLLNEIKTAPFRYLFSAFSA